MFLPRLAAIIAVCLLSPQAAHAQFSFQGLGGAPAPDVLSVANGISGDGRVIAGSGNVAPGLHAARWTQATGLVGLGDLPGGAFSSHALGISSGGDVIVGGGNSASGFEAFRWTSGLGMIGLGDLPGTGSFASAAHAVSADGRVIVGRSQRANGSRSYEAFRWTPEVGIASLGDLPGGEFFSIAFDVSADGSLIVGGSASAAGSEAFRWTPAGGMAGLGDLPGGFFSSSAQAVSADGRVIVGSAASASGFEAFRWTAGQGMVGLGDLPGDIFSSAALDVSADGSVVVGSGSGLVGASGAFVWTRELGMVSLRQYLLQNGVEAVAGWQLMDARAVSADGRTVAGVGVNPAGQFEGWVATIELDVAPPDPGETIAPSAVTVTAGTPTGGGLAQILASDDTYLAVQATGRAALQVVVEAFASVPQASELRFSVEAAGRGSAATQQVELFDFAANAWTLMDTRAATTTDSATTIRVTNNPARFIQPGTGRVRARLTCMPTGKKRDVTRLFVDHAFWARLP